MNKLRFILIAVLAGVTLGGCLKKDFDNPPNTSSYDPGLPANTTRITIGELLKMKPYTGGGLDTMLITQDYALTLIVNADDRAGNLYKSIFAQDSTGGIQLYINAYSLYNRYPVGRKLYVKLKGLYLSYNSGTGTPCLSQSLNEQAGPLGLAGSGIDEHIIKANTGNVVKDTVITFAQARTYSASQDASLLGRLVTIADSVQFADTVSTYTSPTDATNRYITTCGSSSYVGNTTPTGMMAVRTDNYATFHAVRLPYGKGTIRGIYTIFRTTPQLILRDTGDVKFYGPRCGSVAPPAPTTTITIDSLRKLYPGTGTFTLPSVKITGTVISDITKGNSSSGNFIIEDASRKSIILYMGSSGSYNLGDSLVIDATGGKLELYNGAMELTGVSTSKITKAATGKTVAPVTLTIAALKASFAQYENVLVKILNATISGGTTYGGNRTLTDATGSISLYTASGATFASTPIPTGAKTVVGIATPFTPGNEIKLRDPAIDVY